MAPRTRLIYLTRPKGQRGHLGSTSPGGSITYGQDSCTDNTNPGDCHSLDVTHYYSEGGRMNKGTVGTYWASWFKDYYVDVLDNWSNFPHHTALPGNMSDVAFATQAAARTNPSRPYVDIPVNVLQLGEITQLIRQRGRSIIREAARENLRYQFGIKPLVSDLVKLCNFQDQVERRVKEIDRLMGPRGLRRTVDCGTFSKSGVYHKVLQSVYAYADGNFFANTTETVRAHVRWMPQVSLRGLSPAAKRALARRAVLGLTVDLGTLWEAVPWTWLIDWGANVSTFLKATRNIIPATLQGVHIMRHTRTEYEYRGARYNDVSIEPIIVVRENKTRRPSFVAPTAHFPFLSGNQMGILASLAVTRMR